MLLSLTDSLFKATQAIVFSLLESDDVVKTSTSLGFQEMCVLAGPLLLYFLTDIEVVTFK